MRLDRANHLVATFSIQSLEKEARITHRGAADMRLRNHKLSFPTTPRWQLIKLNTLPLTCNGMCLDRANDLVATFSIQRLEQEARHHP